MAPTFVASAAQALHRLDIAAPVFIPAYPLKSADIAGPVTPTGLTWKSANLLRLGLELIDLRDEARRLRNLRRNKAASLIEAQSRRVVIEILARIAKGLRELLR